MQPQPPKGQGGYARKVMDTVAQRDRLKAENAVLVATLETLSRELAPWLTAADAGLPAVIKTLGDCVSLHNAQRKARAVIARSKESTS